MERAADGPIVVIVDTSCLINFLIVDRMDIFGALSGYAFVVPNHVVAEVKDPAQRTRFEAALKTGALTEIEITDLAEIELYVAPTDLGRRRIRVSGGRGDARVGDGGQREGAPPTRSV